MIGMKEQAPDDWDEAGSRVANWLGSVINGGRALVPRPDESLGWSADWGAGSAVASRCPRYPHHMYHL